MQKLQVPWKSFYLGDALSWFELLWHLSKAVISLVMVGIKMLLLISRPTLRAMMKRQSMTLQARTPRAVPPWGKLTLVDDRRRITGYTALRIRVSWNILLHYVYNKLQTENSLHGWKKITTFTCTMINMSYNYFWCEETYFCYSLYLQVLHKGAICQVGKKVLQQGHSA